MRAARIELAPIAWEAIILPLNYTRMRLWYTVRPTRVNTNVIMKSVTIYTTQTCTYCKMAKEFFKEKGVNYTEVDLGTNTEKREEMRSKMEAAGHGLAVPIIDVDNKLILGFDRNTLAAEIGIVA